MTNFKPFSTSRLARLTACFLFFILASFTPPQNKKIKIYLVGDSTMCLYDKTRFPQEGWGMPFANFFDSSVQIDNRARGGRSSRSFMAEKLWQPILDSLQEGDYVLIQFGHNDPANSADHPDRKTTPEEFGKFLTQYVTEARSKKAIPILITPVTLRKFDKDGKVMETHAPYSQVMMDVAAANKVPLIDLDGKSRELVQKLGPDFSKYLYLDFEPGDTPNYPRGYHDLTHFCDFGARKMAEIVLNEIRAQNLELANHIVKQAAPGGAKPKPTN